MLSTYKLNSLLGVVVKTRTSVKRGDPFEHDRDLIASPSRKPKKMTVLDRQVKLPPRYLLKWSMYSCVCVCMYISMHVFLCVLCMNVYL